jgi:hypothetical protein
MELLRAAPLLANEAGTDDDAISAQFETAVSLERQNQLSDPGESERINQPAEQEREVGAVRAPVIGGA